MSRIAVVTGGESGIGKAIVHTLCRAGYVVGFTWYRSAEEAHRTAVEVAGDGPPVTHRYLDLSAPETAGPSIEDLADDMGGLDVLVNNAAMPFSAPFVDTPLADWQQVITVNLTGAFVCAQAAARRMIRTAVAGRIINISSVQQRYPTTGSSAYGSAKAGLAHLTRNMALELGRHGILVNAVAPGEINTAMSGREGVPPERVPRPDLPVGRPGSPHEVAELVHWLASEQSSYATGATFVIDGGATMLGPELALRDDSDVNP
jgi:NAD(P)-dependent dehydrogenase (short-subunit alcohol dehydrogenase family)